MAGFLCLISGFTAVANIAMSLRRLMIVFFAVNHACGNAYKDAFRPRNRVASVFDSDLLALVRQYCHSYFTYMKFKTRDCRGRNDKTDKG
ncbi:hypothetical protein WM40_05570 [Robbsia andropogonis]|uniref:Uncharacterized protein n=1 Tax=Robbsia andropogonis TaxID=28092 RepID=A0A0F5K2S2_9BURK|nr:hypothetical protein WM40_05570 [Robbsia andropogonis]